MEDGGMCHTSFKQSTWGARGRRASRAPKQVEFRILRGFPSYGGWKKTSRETLFLHHVVINGIWIYVQYQFDAGIWSMNSRWFLCFFLICRSWENQSFRCFVGDPQVELPPLPSARKSRALRVFGGMVTLKLQETTAVTFLHVFTCMNT